MNFRELFSKLDSIVEYQAPPQGITARPTSLQPTQNLDGSVRPGAAAANAAQSAPTIPGAQPALGPKPTIQAQQFPNQTPLAPAVAPTDPKADVNAMTRALQAVVGKTNQPQLQPTTSASIQQQQSNTPNQAKQINTAKPGEPLEEAGDWTADIRNRKDTTTKYQDYQNNDSPSARRMRDYIAHIRGNPSDLYAVEDPKLRKQIALEINKDKALKASVVAAAPQRAVAAAQEQPADANKPAADANKPAADANKPAADANKPAADANKPAADANKPAADAENSAEVKKKKEWAKGVVGRGQSGEQVGKLQQQLVTLGLLAPEDVDQKFGPKTQEAVKQFQAQQGLKGREGAVGRETAPALAAAVTAAANKTPNTANAGDNSSEFDDARKPLSNTAPAKELSPEDKLKADRDRITAAQTQQQELDAAKGRVADDDFGKKYGTLDRSQQIRQTGNMQKNRFDLKAGDVDYDARGVKHVWQPGIQGSPGEWQASFDSFSDWKKEPGLGVVGDSSSSEAGKKYVADRQARILNPEQQARYDRLYPEKKSAAAVKAEPAVVPKLPSGVIQPGDVQPALANKKVQAVDLGLTDADRAMVVPRKADGSIDLGVTDADIKNSPKNPDGSVKLEQLSKELSELVQELNEWNMSDRIHKDVPYSYSDAATDAGVAGLGALATYATGGLAAPVAGAATVVRGGRLVNMLNKAYQGTKNVAKGAKEIATNPEVRAIANKNLPGVVTTGAKTGIASAGSTTGLNAASDALDETNADTSTAELEKIKKLSKG